MPRRRSKREAVGYAVWSTDGERNDTKTADILGLPQTTVSYWHRTYGWDERYRATNEAETLADARRALRMAQDAMPLVIDRLLWLATSKKPLRNRCGEIVYEDGEPVMVPVASNGDAVRAGKLLLDYGFPGPTDGARLRPAPPKLPTMPPKLPDPFAGLPASFRRAMRRPRH